MLADGTGKIQTFDTVGPRRNVVHDYS
jgi:hypothetical protein